MSLDVYITSTGHEPTECVCPHCDNRHMAPGRVTYHYQSNITHNLGEMAEAAGIYEPLWHPERVGITKAEQLIPLLTGGLKKLEDDPEKFYRYNSPTGWGLYEHFVPWVREYLNACKKYPNGNVRAST